MARLYSLADAGAHDDPEFGHFEPDPEHGGFSFPDEVSDRIGRSWCGGRRQWETETERSVRLHGEESARRRDPETLYNAVAEIAKVANMLAALQLGAATAAAEDAPPATPPVAPKAPAAAKAPAKPAAKQPAST